MIYRTLKLLERWYWQERAWKGEVKLTFFDTSQPQYTTATFKDIYQQWIRKTHSIGHILKEQAKGNESGQLDEWLSLTEYEFDYYKGELMEIAGNLDLGKWQRFKGVMAELQHQYHLLYEAFTLSDESVFTLLSFLRELPGRLTIILEALIQQPSDEPPERASREHLITEMLLSSPNGSGS